MTDTEKREKLEALSDNEAFLEAMKAAEGKEAVQKVFAEHGLDLTREEVDAFVLLAERELSGELSEEDLESIAGGASGVKAEKVFEWAWKATKAIAKWCWNAGRKFANWEASR